MWRKNMKVLLIDDNQQISKMLTTALELEGHECTSTNDGKSGIKLMEEQEFDTVLLDLYMPEFSGFQVIDHLEKTGGLKKNKVIVFTAASITTGELEELVKRGIHSYLTKPVDLQILLDRITAK